MSLRDDIVQMLKDKFIESTDFDLGDEDSFLEHEVIGSVGMMELVSTLELRYSIKIGDNELTPENLDSVAGIVSMLTAKNVSP